MSIDSTTAFAQPLQRLASEIPISEIFETIPRPKIPSLFSNAVQEQIKPTRAMVETIPMQNVTTDTVSVASELAKSGSPPGYPQVADFMGDHPTLAMVRRFRGLNARNLLYLQAELVLIENKLLEQEKIDAKNDATKQYARDYQWIIPPAGGEGSEQWRLIKEMKDKLKEYNDVLIQQTTLAKISNPSKYDAKTMQNWFERDDLGDMPLEGDDSSIWAKPGRIKDGDGVSRHAKDLIAIYGQSSDFDQATSWLVNKFVPTWHNRVASHFHNDIRLYQESSLRRFTAIVATTLSSLLPVLSIVVLYLVHSMPVRLGVIATFTAGFSIALSIITSASRVDNFAATAAFAAVQVVFVGTNGNSTSSG